MASVIMEDAVSKERIRAETFLKAFHEASLMHKVVCLVAECVGNVLFFEENGLLQHFRVAH
jgi:hypothetical protein